MQTVKPVGCDLNHIFRPQAPPKQRTLVPRDCAKKWYFFNNCFYIFEYELTIGLQLVFESMVCDKASTCKVCSSLGKDDHGGA